MQSYQLILQSNHASVLKRFCWFVLFAHLLIAALVFNNHTTLLVKSVAASTALLLVIAMFFLWRLKGNIGLHFYGSISLLITLFWWLQLAWLPGIVLPALLVAAWYFHLQKDTVICSKDGLLIQSIFVKKQHQWAECEQVLVKDQLLTIDFKNNRLLQIPLDATAHPINEATFNAFCTACIDS